MCVSHCGFLTVFLLFSSVIWPFLGESLALICLTPLGQDGLKIYYIIYEMVHDLFFERDVTLSRCHEDTIESRMCL